MERTSVDQRENLASYQQYKDFIASVLWTDMQVEIRAWIDDIHGYLENETDIQEIYRFQGRLQACKQLLTLPERILSNMEIVHESRDNQEEVISLDLDTSIDVGDSYYTEQLHLWAAEDKENG